MNKEEIKDIQCECPHCNLMNCYETKYEDISVFLCFTCGFTSNSKMIVDSEYVKKEFEQNQQVAKFIKNMQYTDTIRNLVWYPTVLQFPSLGVIFPEPINDTEWEWVYAQEVPILEEEKEKFKMDGTDEYYKTKLDVENAKHYNKFDFYTACIDAKIIIQPTTIN